ncbi:MAG: PLP-dependent aminotransferase family protein, partial [Staphylococcus epidermidis]|nr:PLP-dependent aminotransferase family protein [Staphylococcus epidermidis]
SMYGSWNDPSGSFYIWFEFSISINVKKLFNESIKENILIQPGEIYDSNYKNYIRFSYSYIDENDINRSLKKLSNIIKKIRN